MKKLMTISLVVAMCAAAVPAWGTLVYNDEATFTGILQTERYLEEFNYTSYAFLGYGAKNFGPVNGFKYSVSSSPSAGLYSVLPGGNGALSMLYGDDTLTIAFTGSAVYAVGGRFFGTDYNGGYITATIHIALSDGTVEKYSNTSIADFKGFTSSVAISSISISIPDADHDDGPYPTVDHLYVGVPEPATMLLLGIGGIVNLIYRKK